MGQSRVLDQMCPAVTTFPLELLELDMVLSTCNSRRLSLVGLLADPGVVMVIGGKKAQSEYNCLCSLQVADFRRNALPKFVGRNIFQCDGVLRKVAVRSSSEPLMFCTRVPPTCGVG